MDEMTGFLAEKYSDLLRDGRIESDLYAKYKVKRGLRNENGTGVLVGLSKVSDVSGYSVKNDVKVPKEGNLYYRNIDIRDVVKMAKGDFGYENTCFLLLFGHYPDPVESRKFKKMMSDEYDLPDGFLENIILPHPSKSLMNHISRSILSLYSFDSDPDNTQILELIRKGISLVSKMPAIVSYCLQAKSHYLDKDSLHIHYPRKDFSYAENILYLSRNDGIFTDIEAKTLDRCLMVHADHSGGNNSAFVGTVVSSTLTDLYSMICASLASLKGPRHGGASMAVQDMMSSVIDDIGLDPKDSQIEAVIDRMLKKDYFDNSGLVYGIGHAIYTKSDPRCEILREEAQKLSESKGSGKVGLYMRFEKIAKKKVSERTGMEACANVDFYAGLIYELLGVPRDLFIPLFAASRVVGWIAHDIETLLYCNKIVRPATKYVGFPENEEERK